MSGAVKDGQSKVKTRSSSTFSPLLKAVILGRLLLGGVAVKDVVVPLGWGACPDVRGVEASSLDLLQVGDQNLVVDHCPEPCVEVITVSVVDGVVEVALVGRDGLIQYETNSIYMQ